MVAKKDTRERVETYKLYASLYFSRVGKHNKITVQYLIERFENIFILFNYLPSTQKTTTTICMY